MRSHRRPLRLEDRRKLARGVLRQFRDGDDIAKVAGRIGQSPRRVHEALDEPITSVQSHLGRGVTADDIAEMTGYPTSFVKFVMRRLYARPRIRQEGPRLLRGDGRNNRKKRSRLKAGKARRLDPPTAVVDLAFDVGTLSADIRALLEGFE